MCQFKSAIVLKNRVFVPDYDSHSDMLKELHIEDDYMHASTQFVRVELSPPDGNRMSDIDGWKLKVDQDITPDWWDEKADLPRIKEAIKDWRVARTLKGGEHEVKDGVWFATDSATVRATGSATVRAYDSATVRAYDSATVRAYDSATVRAPDSATARATGSATVEATDSATVEAYGSATVRATGSATVWATDSATVEATDSATVEAYGSATVRAYGSATVRATDSATVEAYGSATVIVSAKYSENVKVECCGEAVCVDRRNHSIKSQVSWIQGGNEKTVKASAERSVP